MCYVTNTTAIKERNNQNNETNNETMIQIDMSSLRHLIYQTLHIAFFLTSVINNGPPTPPPCATTETSLSCFTPSCFWRSSGGDRRPRRWGGGGGGGGTIPENDFCIKMGSDVSHLKFYSLQGGKSQDSVHNSHVLKRKAGRPNVRLFTSLYSWLNQPTSTKD